MTAACEECPFLCDECEEEVLVPVTDGDLIFCSTDCRDKSAERVSDAYARMDWGQ